MIESRASIRPNAMRLSVDLVEANAADRQRVASQQRLLAPSDDAADWAGLSSVSRARSDNEAWSANIGVIARMGEAVDSRLGAMQSAMDRALEIAIAAGSPVFNDTARAAAVAELRGIATELAGLVQGTDPGGLPLFSDSPLMLPVGAQRTEQAGFSLSRLESGSGVRPEAAVSALADALALPGNQQSFAAARQGVTDAVQTVAVARSVAGAGNARIDRMAGQMAEARNELDEAQARLGAPDIAALIARIEERQLTIDAANALYARINRVTLFDLLR